MKKLLVLTLVLAISTLLRSQQIFSKDELEVQQAVVSMFDAISNRDSVALKISCSTGITLYEYGQVWNIDTLILKAITLNQAADFKRTNAFDFICTTTDNRLAWLTYRLSSAIIKDGRQAALQWLETVVLSKEKNGWKVTHLHSTLLGRN